MSLSAGALLGLLGVSAAGNLASGAVGAYANYKADQKLADQNYEFSALLNQANYDFQAREAAKARDFEHFEAQIARDFSLDYDSTKFQRQVRDMIEAGLNPALLTGVSNTVGASSPMASSGHAPSGSAGSFGNQSFNFNWANSAFSTGLLDSLSNDKYRDGLLYNTGKQLELAADRFDLEKKFKKEELKQLKEAGKYITKDGRRKFSNPAWLKQYERDFENGVVDL